MVSILVGHVIQREKEGVTQRGEVNGEFKEDINNSI